MGNFDDLFADLGPTYSSLVRSYLEIKAERGDALAIALLTDGTPYERGHSPGDAVVDADGVLWVWDSSDGEDWQWWSPQLRTGKVEFEDPTEVETVIGDGRRIMPEAAIELFDAISWALTQHKLCEQLENPRTKALYFKSLDIADVSTLVDLFRTSEVQTPLPSMTEPDLSDQEG